MPRYEIWGQMRQLPDEPPPEPNRPVVATFLLIMGLLSLPLLWDLIRESL